MNKEKYTAFGMAAIIPGLQRAVDVLQAEIDGLRETLAHIQVNGFDTDHVEPVAVVSVQPKRWTEEQRKATSERMSQGRKNGTITPPQNTRKTVMQSIESHKEGAKSYWSKMTRAQRVTENRRRRKVAEKNRKAENRAATRQIEKVSKLLETARVDTPAPTHPRDPRHPKHKQYREKLRIGQKKYLDSLTPEQRKEHFQKITAVRKAREGKCMMTRLSTLQYNMLRMFSEEGTGFFMSIVNAQKFDQRPFRSMLLQKWVEYHPGKGFHVTRSGMATMRDFESHDITRKNPSLPLTSYFDPTAYGLKTPVKRRRNDATRAKLEVVA